MVERGRLRVALLLVVSLAGPHAFADDATLVRGAFTSYKESLLNGQGTKAAAALTAGSFHYYATMRDQALYGTKAELDELSRVDLIQTLTLRHRVPPKELRGMSGRELVIYAIDRGWIGKGSVARIDIGEVTVDGDAATAVVVNRRGPSSQRFHFRKEDGLWKFDLVQLLALAEQAFEFMAAAQDLERDEFAERMLEEVSGKPVGPEIWQPPLER